MTVIHHTEALVAAGGIRAPVTESYHLLFDYRDEPRMRTVWAFTAGDVKLRDGKRERRRLEELQEAVDAVRAGREPATTQVPWEFFPIIRAPRGAIRFIQPPERAACGPTKGDA